ncbi:MAG: DUF815 domain-containing protein [Micavibrio sp.]
MALAIRRAHLKIRHRYGGASPSLPLRIDPQIGTLTANPLQSAGGYPADSALPQGARGTGKSSLVKSVHAALAGRFRLKLTEI